MEKEWNISLPEDYKLFLTQVGNGGMGPFYGLLPLELDPKKQTNLIEGTVCLAHEGCGYYHHLGIEGEKKGKIYLDLEAADGGICELKVTSFFEWYEFWLNGSLKTLG